MSEIKIIPTAGRNNCGGRCIIYAHVRNGFPYSSESAPSAVLK